MNCPLCGVSNERLAENCFICDTPLKSEVFVEKEEGGKKEKKADSSRRRSWKRFLIPLSVFFLFFVSWVLFGDLFFTPPEVEISRQRFYDLSESHQRRKEKWGFQKDQILEAMKLHRSERNIGKRSLYFEGIPLEILFAFFEDNLDWMSERFEKTTIFPTENLDSPSFILSRKENLIWPFQTVISLEIDLDMEGGRVVPKFVRLRKGSKELFSSLAWEYFNKELQALRSFEMFSGGIKHLEFYKKKTNKKNSFLPVFLSWEYLHRPISSS